MRDISKDALKVSNLLFLIKYILQRFSFILLIFALTGLIVLDRTYPSFSQPLKQSIIDSLSPIMDSIGKFANVFLNISSEIDSILNVRKENILLKQEMAILKYHYNISKQLESENLQLRKLLNFIGEPKFGYVTARIVANASGPYVKSSIVTAGTEQGVKKGQIVVSNEGLVGRIIDVGARSSRILLITDLNSKIPAVTLESRERTIIAGNNSETLEGQYLSEEAKVRLGELVVTSGDGEYFPRGIPLGVVSAVKGRTISIRPVADCSKLEYVSIINY